MGEVKPSTARPFCIKNIRMKKAIPGKKNDKAVGSPP